MLNGQTRRSPYFSIPRSRLHPPVRPPLWGVWRGIAVPAVSIQERGIPSGADRRSIRGGTADRCSYRHPSRDASPIVPHALRLLARGRAIAAALAATGYLAAELLLGRCSWSEPAARIRPGSHRKSGRCLGSGCVTGERAPRLRIRLGPGRRLRRLYRRFDHCRMGDRVAWPEHCHLAAGSIDADGAVRPSCRVPAVGARRSNAPPITREGIGSPCSACPCSGGWCWVASLILGSHALHGYVLGHSLEGRRRLSPNHKPALVAVRSGRGAGVLRRRTLAVTTPDPGRGHRLGRSSGCCPMVRRRFDDRCDGAVGDTEPLHGVTFALLHLAVHAGCWHG